MKKLREASLAIGDIILTTGNAPVSKAIRTFTDSDISHAMIYVDNYSVIDATDEGVQARNTQRIHFPDDCAVHVLRPKTPLSQEEVSTVCNFVRSRVGTQYSTREAVQTALGGSKSWSRKQFCSRLVAQAYHSIGRSLVQDANYCSPDDLKNSALLMLVDDVVRPMSTGEVEQWQSNPDMTQVMRDITNVVLEGARKKDCRIQDLSDLNQYLVEHPEDDAYFCELYKTSGYLTFWRMESEKYPWRYDLAIMQSMNLPKQELTDYCNDILRNAEEAGTRFHNNLAGYLHLVTNYELETFRLLKSLYEILVDQHTRRCQVAKSWLMLASGETEFPDPYATPHSPEWFATLSKWNPLQAEATRSVIDLAGSANVCSVCGDTPAVDYKLDNYVPPPGAVATLRLCADCLAIRKDSGECYIPLLT